MCHWIRIVSQLMFKCSYFDFVYYDFDVDHLVFEIQISFCHLILSANVRHSTWAPDTDTYTKSAREHPPKKLCSKRKPGTRLVKCFFFPILTGTTLMCKKQNNICSTSYFFFSSHTQRLAKCSLFFSILKKIITDNYSRHKENYDTCNNMKCFDFKDCFICSVL